MLDRTAAGCYTKEAGCKHSIEYSNTERALWTAADGTI